ncbi:MAG: AMP-binding protein [Stappiaceae bacterium]
MAFVGDKVTAHAGKARQAAALICGSQSVTRGILAEQVVQIAFAVSRRVVKGAPVGVDLENGPEFLATFLGIARAGCKALVFDPNWPTGLRQSIIEATTPAITIDASTFGELTEQSIVETVADPSEADAFYVGFTSGTTGIPKGFRRSHASWLESFAVAEHAFGLSENDVFLICGSLQHSLHLFGAVHALHIGALTVQLKEFRPVEVLRQTGEHRATVLYCTPTQLHYLIKTALARKEVFPSVRCILTSGAKWRGLEAEELRRCFPAATVSEFYGASETSFITVVPQDAELPVASVGRAPPGVEISIRDADGAIVNEREVGRVWVKSAMLFDGYECGESGDTRWDDNGWLTVGDHGWVDEKGLLYLTGRENRMIITSAVNVYPEEVERVLEAHPQVELAAVFGVDEPVRGQKIVAAFKSVDQELEIEIQVLRRWCRRNLAKEKVPRTFISVSDWPLTQGGKTNLETLRIRLFPDSGSGSEKVCN